MAKLDQLADTFGNTNNPLGSLIGFGLRHRLGVPAGASLLRGMGRGLGSLRDRMSPQDSSFDSWSEDDSSSPRKIFSDDGDSGNSGEILIRLTSIENILRGMSQLAIKSNERDAASVETDRQSQEELHRLAERPDDPRISMSPIRVEEEEKSGGIFSSLFSGLGKFAGLIGPGSKLILGLIGLAGVATAAKLAWDKFFPDKSVTDAATEALGSAARRLADEPGSTPGVVSGDTGFQALGASLMDPVIAGQGALARGVPAGIVATQAAQQAINATRVAGMGVKAPFQGIRNAGRWTSNAVRNNFRAATNRTPTTLGNLNPSRNVDRLSLADEAKPSLWRRLFGMGKNAPRVPRAPLLGIGRFGVLGAGLQGGTALYDTTQGNYGQAGTGALSTATMFGGPLVQALGFAISAALTDYKTQDETEKNILGHMGPDFWGDWGKGGVGTGMVSDTMGSWLFRGGSQLGFFRPEEPEPARWSTANDGAPAPGDKAGVLHSKLQGAGYSPDQAEGIIQNLRDESGLNERAVGDDGTALGIAQWRGDRANNMKAFAADNPEMSRFDAQVGFLIKELADYGGSPQQMPVSMPAAHDWMLRNYEKPSDVNIEKRLSENWASTPPGDTHASASLYNSAATVGALNRAVDSMRTNPSPSRQLEPQPDAADTTSSAPTAVVAPQTTNNYFDNRNTTIMPPPLDARNREAVLMAMQNLQGLTHATG